MTVFEDAAFIGAVLLVIGLSFVFSQPAPEIEKHIRSACEVAWPEARTYQIDRCVHRGMAAMTDENRLRDNELKRLLMSCEAELKGLKDKPK